MTFHYIESNGRFHEPSDSDLNAPACGARRGVLRRDITPRHYPTCQEHACQETAEDRRKLADIATIMEP
jgi:hypothetical protein